MPRNSNSLTSALRALCAAAIEPSLSDRELVAKFVHQHDQVAFTALVRRHASIVWSVCRRVLGQHADVEDAVQATFVLLARKASGLKQPELVGAWLHGVARKVALQARGRRPADREVPLVQDLAQTEEPLDVLSGREVLAILDEELARLPDEYRAVLLLCCIEGKSREEAAHRLGWTEGSVKGRLERGRDLLSRRLTRRGLTLSATLAAALVWQSASAKAAIPLPLSTPGVEAATPQAVALANAVAGSLGSGVWAKWGVLGALLLTSAGVGVGIWGYCSVQPDRPPVVQAATPNQAAPGQSKPNVAADHPLGPERPAPPDRPAVAPESKPGPTWTGWLRGVDPESRRVTLRAREAERAYRLAQTVDLRIDGAPAGLADLAALGGKTSVKVMLNAAGTEILSLLAEGEVVTGTLLNVSATRNTITLRRSVTDPKASAITWPLAVGATVTLDGQPATLAELSEGSAVSARLSADGKRIVSLEAKSP
jgi:RNA polymerase sigma factor (sigma-70 family)